MRESKHFLDDLRGLARTGSLAIEPSRVDLEAVVAEVLFEQRELLANRGIHVDVRSPLAAVWCHRQRAKQVLTNLVRNAAIHGCDADRPRVTISTARSAAARDGSVPRISIHVHDNGPGIDRKRDAAPRKGSGVGLVIVRKIAEHYGGTVRIESHRPGGTTVGVTLPAADDSHPLARPHWEFSSLPEQPARSTVREAGHPPTPTPPHPPRNLGRRLRGRP
jgi:signal transduction histidine kinase